MSEVKLPEGWCVAKIEDVSAKCSQRIPQSDENFTYVDIGSINRELKVIESPQYLLGETAPSRARKSIEEGDILVSLTRPNLNAVALVTKDYNGQIASTGFEVIKPILVDSRYIFSITRSKHFINEISGAVQGALYPAAKSGDVQKYKLPLPPLAEQKIIADKLDTLLSQLGSAKARLEQIPQILKRFRQSVLAAAVSGKLTEEWRETQDVAESAEQLFDRWLSNRESNFENSKNKATEKRQTRPNKKFKIPIGPDIEKGKKIEIPSSWKLISVSQFSDCLDNQRIPIRKEDRNVSKGLYPYFGANGEVDKVDNYIFDGDFVLVTEDETFYGREKPIAYRYSGKCWVNNHAHVLSAQTKEANDFLCYTLMYYDVIPWLTGTTGRAKLTQGALNVLPIGLPSEIEILEIVRRVEQLFAYADTIEKQVHAALLRVNNLTQSILAKAFRGELTAQWRAENPGLINGENSAEALLVRIKQERLKNKPVKRGKGNS